MDPWQTLDTHLWQADYALGIIRARTWALRLADGSPLIISPGTRLSSKSEAFFKEVGQPKWLLAPNHFHHAGVKSWREQLDLKLACAPGARARLEKLGYTNLHDLESLTPLLNPNTHILPLPGSRTGEVLIISEGEKGATWLICDAYLNIDKPAPGLLMGILTKLLRMGPGLVVSRQFRYFFIKDWPVFRKWLLGLLERYPPVLVSPSHGLLIEDNPAERLRAVLP